MKMNYETFVNDPVRLQKNMEAAQQKHKKDEIQEALYYSDSEAMSDIDTNEWENQQIAKAQPTLVKVVKRDPYAMPSEIPVVTTYTAAMTRLREQLDAMKSTARRSYWKWWDNWIRRARKLGNGRRLYRKV